MMIKEKNLGQVFTPTKIVDLMIYEGIKKQNVDILNKKILEPSCGNGVFLLSIAQIIIDECKSRNYNDEYIKSQLLNIYGWDIDKECVRETIYGLNKLLEYNNLDFTINWNVKKADALIYNNNDYFNSFDIIIGNPPYIKIQNLSIEQRETLKNNFKLCSIGSSNTYIAFFELAINLLKKDGICVFITPNSYLYTQSGKLLKDKLIKYVNLIKIIDLTDKNIFEDFGVYPVITIFDKKNIKHDSFVYEKLIDLNEKKYISVVVEKERLKDKVHWGLNEFIIGNKKEVNGKKNKIKLKEICDIYTGVQTSLDWGFIFTNIMENEKDKNLIYAYSRLKAWIEIEKEIVKKIIKASRLKDENNVNYEYILFPYENKNESNFNGLETGSNNNPIKDKEANFEIICEEVLKNKYPLAYDYLLSIKYNLLKIKRNNAKELWYSFGRFQGLTKTYGKKIIFPNIANYPRFVFIEQDDILFYSGFCIKIKDKYQKTISYDKLVVLLNSQEMYNYIKSVGFVYSGGYYGMNKNIVENFDLDSDCLV